MIEGQTVIKIAENTCVEVVDDFKYLGAYIANSHTDFNRRKGVAWIPFWKFTTVWKSKEASLSVTTPNSLSYALNLILQI